MPDKIKVLIVDDEPMARQFIRHLLKTDAEIEIVGEAKNGKAAAEFIRENAPDLVFLDIQMPELDGFSMLAQFEKETLPAIIFTTAFEEYAIRSFEFHALDYLLKPFDAERFFKAVEYAKKRLLAPAERQQENEQIEALIKNVGAKNDYLERFLIKQSGRLVYVKTDEIELVKSDDKYVLIYVKGKSYLVRQTLGAMKTELDPRRFVQIHRSAIINIEKIQELESAANGDYTVVLENGARIPVSRSFKDDLFRVLGEPL